MAVAAPLLLRGDHRATDGIAQLTAMNVLLPCQMAQGPAPSPERALLAAMLEDALRCAQGAVTAISDPDRQSRRVTEARAWIAGAAGPFRFVEVCAYLGLDADWIREGLDAVVATRKRPRDHGGYRNRVPLGISLRP